jgi:hypothetical protein
MAGDQDPAPGAHPTSRALRRDLAPCPSRKRGCLVSGTAAKRRDSLRTPRVIKRNLERDTGKAKPSAKEISEEPEIKKRGPGIAAAIDEAVIDLRQATDDIVHKIGGGDALVLDLTPDGMQASVETFVEYEMRLLLKARP